MKNSFVKIILAAIISFSMFSCEKDKGPIIKKPMVPVDPLDTFIHYSLFVQPVFDYYCTRCHNESHPNLDLREGISYDQLLFEGLNAPYVDTLNPDNSMLMMHLDGNFLERMPPEPPYPSETEIDSIRQWMSQGARNN